MTGTAEKIVNFRTNAGLSQQELADKLFVSRSLVSKWEAGTRVPDGLSVSKMAELFGVSESDVIDDSGFASSSPAELKLIEEEIGEFTEENGDGAGDTDRKIMILDRFLAKQNRKNRELFKSRYFMRETAAKIAEEYGMTPSSVRVRLMRMRKNLKRFIEQEERHDKKRI